MSRNNLPAALVLKRISSNCNNKTNPFQSLGNTAPYAVTGRYLEYNDRILIVLIKL